MICHPGSEEKETRDTCDAFELTVLSADLPGKAITPRRRYPKSTELMQRAHEVNVRRTRFSDVTRIIFWREKGKIVRVCARERYSATSLYFFRYFSTRVFRDNSHRILSINISHSVMYDRDFSFFFLFLSLIVRRCPPFAFYYRSGIDITFPKISTLDSSIALT